MRERELPKNSSIDDPTNLNKQVQEWLRYSLGGSVFFHFTVLRNGKTSGLYELEIEAENRRAELADMGRGSVWLPTQNEMARGVKGYTPEQAEAQAKEWEDAQIYEALD